MEEAVASVFSQVLKVEGIGPDDDIFELGGDSMQAVQIAMQLEERFDVEIPLEELEDSARVRDAAAFIERALAAAHAGA